MAKNNKNFQLPKSEKEKIVSDIINYFNTERDEEIGILSAELLLDFLIERIAPEFYNLGITDAMNYMAQATEDMESLKKY